MELKKNEIMTKSINEVKIESDRVLSFIATEQVRDRDGDVVFVDKNEVGEGLLTQEYMANPVFLKCHNIDGNEYPIGKTIDLQKVNGPHNLPAVKIGVEFAKTEDGEDALYLYKEGFLNMTSIRFRPVKYVFNEKAGGYDVHESILREVSAVPIGANQYAMIVKGAKAVKENEMLKIENEIRLKKMYEIAETLGVRKNTNGSGVKKSLYDAILDFETQLKIK